MAPGGSQLELQPLSPPCVPFPRCPEGQRELKPCTADSDLLCGPDTARTLSKWGKLVDLDLNWGWRWGWGWEMGLGDASGCWGWEMGLGDVGVGRWGWGMLGVGDGAGGKAGAAAHSPVLSALGNGAIWAIAAVAIVVILVIFGFCVWKHRCSSPGEGRGAQSTHLVWEGRRGTPRAPIWCGKGPQEHPSGVGWMGRGPCLGEEGSQLCFHLPEDGRT